MNSVSTLTCLLLTSLLRPTIHSQFNLYHTEPILGINQVGFDCLYYYVRQGNRPITGVKDQIESNVHMIDYCLRPSDDISIALTPHFVNLRDKNFTFAELRALNITPEQLLPWSASMDLAERYKLFIDGTNTNNSSSTEIFYNCTRPWFGSLCQYTFDYRIGMAFVDVVRGMLEDKFDANNEIDDLITNLTCYVHIRCDRGQPLCLDWREVCNGRIDCLDGGADEAHCLELTMNQCGENEYRCFNGLCIPIEFRTDDPTNPDCLDGSDEMQENSYTNYCQKDPTFRCEELSCEYEDFDFACGDGQCVPYYDSCVNGRQMLLYRRLLSKGNLTHECWLVMVCFAQVTPEIESRWCNIYNNDSVIRAHLSTCDNVIHFPTVPVAFNHVHFFYHNNYSRLIDDRFLQVLNPDFVCYDERLCPSISSTFSYGDLTCRSKHDMRFTDYLDFDDIMSYVEKYFRNCSTRPVVEKLDNYQWSSADCSKNPLECIAKDRLLERIPNDQLSESEGFEIDVSRHGKFYSLFAAEKNRFREQYLDHDSIHMFRIRTNSSNILFQRICDGKQDLIPEMINGKNHSDETDCEYWPCDNIYTRCNGFWTCPNGRDEGNCIQSSCPSDTHSCISPMNFTLSCLSMDRVTDGIIDCIGASDEPKYCRGPPLFGNRGNKFSCWNESKCLGWAQLCDQTKTCRYEDDERFCRGQSILCFKGLTRNRTEIEDVICQLFDSSQHVPTYFSLKTSSIYPPVTSPIRMPNSDWPIELVATKRSTDVRSYNPKVVLRCNRGLNARLWLGGNTYNYRCFCPSSFYGKLCQYQNQRVSLTLRVLPIDRTSIYEFVTKLIDETGEIHSYQQFVFLAGWGCHMKFNNYLLYSDRPKSMEKNYSVHIDVFDKVHMINYASWHLTIPFPFLPVHRLVALLHIPPQPAEFLPSCDLMCQNNGRCVKYVNKEKFFCQCPSDWTGSLCDIPTKCDDCSSDSICAGSSKNRSICVCPMDKFGSRCLLTSCSSNTCKNNGQCVVVDGRSTKKKFSCVCPEQFYGTNCEYTKQRLEISFNKMGAPSYILLYTIAISNNSHPDHAVMFRKFAHRTRSATFYILKEFHMAFAKIDNRYYLLVVQQYPRDVIHTSVESNRQCPSITALLNSTIMAMVYIQRIKYYHLPCRTRPNLWCFFDEENMCLCTLERHANCFRFNQSSTFDCSTKDHCQNDGLCFEDQRVCPLTKTCICDNCFFGTQCQFYAKGISLTLDDILRYEIRQNLPFSEQPLSIKISTSLTLVMFFLGLIDGIVSYLTFCRTESQKVGCGLYLLASAVTSIFTVTLFTVKYFFLIFSQLNFLTNRSLLHWGCILIEPSLKACLYADNWFNACVSLERAIAISKGVRFNKPKSKRIARLVILILPFLIIITLVHEFLHRHLFDDVEERQTWCVIDHSQGLKIYNLLVTCLHFFTPFLINLFSALWIIVGVARRHSVVRAENNYKQHLREQFNEHKHILISIIILLMLSLPRLIISFISDCVRSSRNPWYLLVGYFISFIPSILLFVVFILPSTLYKGEFQKAMKFCQTRRGT